MRSIKYILLILLSLFMCVGNVSASKEEIYPGDEIRGAYVRVNSQDLKVTFNYDVNEKLIYLNNVDDVVNEVTDEEWDLIQKIMYYDLHNTYYRGLLLCLDSESSEYWYFFV